MAKMVAVLKCVGPKLVPFFQTVTLFFIFYGDDSKAHHHHGLIYSICKCLPIVSLIFFVLLHHGMDFSEVYTYSRRILIGLILSLVGDIFMVYKDIGYFYHAIGTFAIAQVVYGCAFGIRPLKLKLALVIYSIATGLYLFFQPNISGMMVPVVVGYITVILFMAWRAMARVQLFSNQWTWPELCGCVGAIVFVISDFFIALDRFCFPVPFAQNIIMTSYFAAQLGITLSVIDSQVSDNHIKVKAN